MGSSFTLIPYCLYCCWFTVFHTSCPAIGLDFLGQIGEFILEGAGGEVNRMISAQI